MTGPITQQQTNRKCCSDRLYHATGHRQVENVVTGPITQQDNRQIVRGCITQQDNRRIENVVIGPITQQQTS